MTSRAILGLQMLGKIYRSNHYYLTADAVSYYETILQCALQKQKLSWATPNVKQESSSPSSSRRKYDIDIERTADCYRGDGFGFDGQYTTHTSPTSSSSTPKHSTTTDESIIKDAVVVSAQAQQQRTRICLDDFWKNQICY